MRAGATFVAMALLIGACSGVPSDDAAGRAAAPSSTAATTTTTATVPSVAVACSERVS